MYAKMGGTPWTVAHDLTVDDEVVVGMGNVELTGSRFEQKQRFMGITTVFRGDGNYLLSNVSRVCRYDEYPAVLEASMAEVLREVKKRNGWQDDDSVRVVFHAHKPLRQVEVAKIVERLHPGSRRGTERPVRIPDSHARSPFQGARHSASGEGDGIGTEGGIRPRSRDHRSVGQIHQAPHDQRGEPDQACDLTIAFPAADPPAPGIDLCGFAVSSRASPQVYLAHLAIDATGLCSRDDLLLRTHRGIAFAARGSSRLVPRRFEHETPVEPMVPMTSPVTQSIARQLVELETQLRTEEHWSQESPEANFARHVFDSVREQGPVLDWAVAPTADVLRRGMAPDLAAFGYRIASHRCEPDAAGRSAWEAGLRKLSHREPFTADRQTFAFRPVEIFGLALGFHGSHALPDDLRSWFRGTIERLGRDYSHDDWGGPLYQTAARLTDAAWSRGQLQQPALPIIEGFALRRWLALAYPDQPGPVSNKDIDQEILRRALLEHLNPVDIARASILYQAIRRASIERLESDLAATWQTDRLTRDGVEVVTNLCRRFQQFALQIQLRHDGRDTVKFDDEYDVQDALHAILRLHFEDVRAEEWTPSYAGNSSRMDFLLKREHIVVEAKMTRKSLRQKDVAEQLIQDKERYRSHPECRELICFVYDPAHFLTNPTALEDDLSTAEPKLSTTVIVSPKG